MTNEKWVQRSQLLFPGGVNSPVRAFKSVGGAPRVIRSASGCRLEDVEGKRYIDYIGGWGPMILGHAHPAVVAAICEAAGRGTTYGTPCPGEVELADLIIARMPWVAKLRFVSSGTEAVMSAIRLARAATGRELIVKFEGCYHGHADSLLVKAGSGVATLGLPDSPGVTAGAAAGTLTVGYNDLESVHRLFDQHRGRIAAVLIEPIAGNMGVVLPEAGFLEGLREVTRANGAVLIFDEVMTGFRVGPGGAAGHYGVEPDLTTLGKVIGGGLPVGAYGGRADLMDMIAPAGSVYQAGTLSGNPLAMAAGIATLSLLDSAAYERIERTSARLEQGLIEVFRRVGTAAAIQRAGSMLTVFFSDRGVRNFEDAKAADHRRFAKFFHAMLERGVHLPPSGYEAWFVSLAHDERAIDATIAAAAAAS